MWFLKSPSFYNLYVQQKEILFYVYKVYLSYFMAQWITDEYWLSDYHVEYERIVSGSIK